MAEQYPALRLRLGLHRPSPLRNPVPRLPHLLRHPLEIGGYHLDAYHCNYKQSNCITGTGSGSVEKSAEAEHTASGGILRHRGVLEKDTFILYRLTPQK